MVDRSTGRIDMALIAPREVSEGGLGIARNCSQAHSFLMSTLRLQGSFGAQSSSEIETITDRKCHVAVEDVIVCGASNSLAGSRRQGTAARLADQVASWSWHQISSVEMCATWLVGPASANRGTSPVLKCYARAETALALTSRSYHLPCRTVSSSHLVHTQMIQMQKLPSTKWRLVPSDGIR